MQRDGQDHVIRRLNQRILGLRKTTTQFITIQKKSTIEARRVLQKHTGFFLFFLILFTTIFNFSLHFFLYDLEINTILQIENVYIPFFFTLFLFFTSVINHEIARICQVIIILLSGYITVILTEPGNLTGTLFILFAIVCIYQYGYFAKNFYRRIIIVFSFYVTSLIINLTTFRHDFHILRSIPTILFTISAIYLFWIVFREEIKWYLIQTHQLHVRLDQYVEENTALSEIARDRAQEIIEKNRVLEEKLEEKRLLEDYLRKTVGQKEVLLREVQHRVKNNLAVMVGMLNLQLQQELTDDMKEFIEKNKNRILTMATVHEISHEDQNFEFIELSNYLRRIADDILSTTNIYAEIETEIKVEKLLVDQNTAIYCGLILNECMTNSVKHAFTNHTGPKKINVYGNPVKNNHYELVIEDNGEGFPGCAEDSTPHNSFGIWLVMNLAEGQLEGTARCEKKNGTRWIIKFPYKIH